MPFGRSENVGANAPEGHPHSRMIIHVSPVNCVCSANAGYARALAEIRLVGPKSAGFSGDVGVQIPSAPPIAFHRVPESPSTRHLRSVNLKGPIVTEAPIT